MYPNRSYLVMSVDATARNPSVLVREQSVTTATCMPSHSTFRQPAYLFKAGLTSDAGTRVASQPQATTSANTAVATSSAEASKGKGKTKGRKRNKQVSDQALEKIREVFPRLDESEAWELLQQADGDITRAILLAPTVFPSTYGLGITAQPVASTTNPRP